MDTFSLQLITTACLLVGNLLFGFLPLLIVKFVGNVSSADDDCIKKVKYATFFLYFGGGVFISNSFLVLLPEAVINLKKYETHHHEESGETSGHHHDSFPIPEFVIFCAFFITYVLQELFCFILPKFSGASRKTSDLRVRFCSCAKRHTECSRTFKDERTDHSLFGVENKLMQPENGTSTVAVSEKSPETIIASKSDLLRSSIITQTVPNYGTLSNITEPATDSPLPVLSPPILLTKNARHAEDEEMVTRDQNKLLVSSLLTTIALTLQYIFLGLDLGIRISPSIKWYYLVMACAQNFILTFSAGSDFIVGNMEHTFVVLHIVVLSVISPIEVMIVMIRRHSVEEISRIARGAVSAIACGILLYTTFYEMLRQKKLGSVVGLTKYFAIILGASVMAALRYAILTL